MDFTYEEPNPERFMQGVLALVTQKTEDELIEVLEGAACTISASDSFSEKRWNAKWTEVVFRVRPDALVLVSAKMEASPKGYCDAVMPKEAGLDVMKVSIVPSL